MFFALQLFKLLQVSPVQDPHSTSVEKGRHHNNSEDPDLHLQGEIVIAKHSMVDPWARGMGFGGISHCLCSAGVGEGVRRGGSTTDRRTDGEMEEGRCKSDVGEPHPILDVHLRHNLAGQDAAEV